MNLKRIKGEALGRLKRKPKDRWGVTTVLALVADLEKAAQEQKRLRLLAAKYAQNADKSLVSRHREGCAHYRNEAQNIFLLSDEDSYDVCTCLKNFVSMTKFNEAVELLRTISLVGLKDSVEERVNGFLASLPPEAS